MDLMYFNELEQALKHSTWVISKLPPFHKVVYMLSSVSCIKTGFVPHSTQNELFQ